MSLRWRLALGLGAITALVVGVVGIGAYVAVADRLQNSVDESLQARAAEVTKAGHDVFARQGDRRERRARHGAGHRSGRRNERRVKRRPRLRRAPRLHPSDVVPARRGDAAGGRRAGRADDGTVIVCIEGGVGLPVTTPTGSSPRRSRRPDPHRRRSTVTATGCITVARRGTAPRCSSLGASARSTTCSIRCGAG